VFALPPVAFSQTPSAEQMIQQLMLPKTRSMRNLVVEEVKAPALVPPVTAPYPPTTAPQPAPPTESSTTNVQQPVYEPPPVQLARPSLSLLIQFDFDSARIRAESHDPLNNLAKALQSSELKASQFAVEGHTDAKGNPQYNLKLSQQRALAVGAFLKEKGVDGARLLVIGKGSAELANPQAPLGSENRRVKIVNLD
jgi:outer membrane protein OmpA-like peptidoglycan-associated protein